MLTTASARAIDLIATGLDGVPITGRAVRIVPEIVLATDDGEKSLAWTDIIDLRPARQKTAAIADAAPPSLLPGTLRFELSDGSIFHARVTEAGDSDFVVTLHSGGATGRVPLDAVRILRSPQVSPYALQNLSSALAETDRKDDVAVVGRDDKEMAIRGAVRRIEPTGVVFELQGRERPLKWNVFAGAAFASAVPRGAVCIVRTLDGEALAGRVSAGDDAGIKLQSNFFKDLAVPWSRIDRIECRSERLVFLSDLRPAVFESHPLLGGKWELGIDRSLTGQPIRLGGKTYAKGLVMRSHARVAYLLGARYKQLAAQVGIADEMGPRGDATLIVLGDNRPLWRADHVRGGGTPRDLLVDVAGIDVLELIVDYGDDLDISDHAVWAFARLIR